MALVQGLVEFTSTFRQPYLIDDHVWLIGASTKARAA